jgi:hypothetical protein
MIELISLLRLRHIVDQFGVVVPWLPPDRATKAMAACLDRAIEISHPHTQAYALYYASILSALRRELAAARSYSERCLS